MSEKVLSEDHRKTLMDLFFAVMLTDGLSNLVNKFILNDPLSTLSDIISNGNQLQPVFQNLSSLIIPPPVSNDITLSYLSYAATFNLLFFLVTFFWIICHWIFYHQLITKYPYYRWRKFFIDITLFSLMFIILHLSLTAYDRHIFPLFVLLIGIWYALSAVWHFADRGLRPYRTYSDLLVVKSVVYISILIIFVISRRLEYPQETALVLMISVILFMIAFNAERLNRFISKKEVISNCCLFYDNEKIMLDFPKDYSPQFFGSMLVSMCAKKMGSSYQKENRTADIIEVLIYYWLNCITNAYDIAYCFDPIKRTAINSIENLSHKNNVFLNNLYSNRNKQDNGIMNITLPEDITVERNFEQGNEQNYPTSGIIAIKRKHFNLKIRYEKSDYFTYSYKSPSLLVRLMPRKGDILLNPIYVGDEFIKKIRNLNWAIYRIELRGEAKLSTRIRSIFQNPAAKEIEWLDELERSFKDFFDIDTYIAKVNNGN
jgi:hypothetical protein